MDRAREFHFEKPPNDDQLAVLVGLDAVGAGFQYVKHEERCEVIVTKIPIKFATVCLLFPVAMAVVIAIVQRDMEWLGFSMFGLFLVPWMVGLASWINKVQGTKPALIFDLHSGKVELPRLEMTFLKHQAREVVFVEFANRLYQVGLLVEVQGQWSMVHVHNSGGRFNDYKKLAGWLDVPSRRIRLNREKAKEIFGRYW